MLLFEAKKVGLRPFKSPLPWHKFFKISQLSRSDPDLDLRFSNPSLLAPNVWVIALNHIQPSQLSAP